MKHEVRLKDIIKIYYQDKFKNKGRPSERKGGLLLFVQIKKPSKIVS